MCNRKFWLSAFLAFLGVLAVSTYRLGQFSLWNDEADTAVLAGSVLKTGLPSADNGRNVLIFDQCSQLSVRGLLSKKIPWVQYYVGALSEAIFGIGDAQIRLLFVVLGCLSVFPLGLLLSEGLGWGGPWMAGAILLQPQTFLFDRNARYYPLLIFEYSLLLWGVFGFSRFRFKSAAVFMSLVLIFHTHPLAALGVSIAVWTWDRKSRLWVILSALSWGVWFLALGETPSGPVMRELVSEKSSFLFSIGASLRDLDWVAALPGLGVLICLGLLFSRKIREPFLVVMGQPVVRFVMATLAAQILLDAAAVGTETSSGFSVLRYMPHLVVGLSFVGVKVVQALSGKKIWLWVVLSAVLLFTNLGTFSFWIGSSSPLSWWSAIVEELGADDPLREVLTQVRNTPGLKPSVRVFPTEMDASVIYYLGDRLWIQPDAQSPSACRDAVEKKVGADRFSEIEKYPASFLVFGNNAKIPGNLSDFQTFRTDLKRGFLDGNRPELTRHEFISRTEQAVRMPVLILNPTSSP